MTSDPATEVRPARRTEHAPVLVVEDDQDVRELMGELLALEGYRVLMAANGKEGLEQLATAERPCVILLDLMMPVMGGLEFLEAKRQDAAIAGVPVVVISAYDQFAAQATGVAQFLSKPVAIDDLLRAVRTHC